jgi:hypothetical protein
MVKTLRFFQALMLAVWLGGMFFFGAVVAPAAFETLPSQRMAGEVVSVTLGRLHTLPFVALAVLFGLTLILPYFQKQSLARNQIWTLIGAALAFSLVLYLRFGIERRMHELRQESNGIESLAPDDPHRIEFNRLHRRSTTVFGGEFVVGLLMLRQFVLEDGKRSEVGI